MESGDSVDDEQQKIRFADGLLDLSSDLDIHRLLWIVRDAAGVDEPERPPVPIGARKVPVAGRTRLLRDDRRLAPDNAIEERGFSDVRPSEKSNNGDAGRTHAAAVPSRSIT